MSERRVVTVLFCDVAGSTELAEKWRAKSLPLAVEIGQPYEQAMTYLEMGRHRGEPDHLRQGKALLAEIGARPDLLEKK